jgi:DNA-binding SARP family transcriptional activator
VPEIEHIATRALAAGLPHAEAAGLLAEAIGSERLVLVLDDLQRLGDNRKAWGVIDAFIRYAPPRLRMVMMSRNDIPSAAGESLATGHIAAVGEAELAFTVEEAAEALSVRDADAIDPRSAVEATGGWVTGVLFEAWRSVGHVAGVGGEADPLHGYLSAHILERVTSEDREFLIRTSLLDVVTAEHANALGCDDAGARLTSIRAGHLPVTWERRSQMMRCHPRFREYLIDLLERRGVDEVTQLRLRHARLLVRTGHHEEATEAFLRADAHTEALASAEQAVFDVIERLDLSIAERWINELAARAPTGARPLITAELMIAIAQDDYRRGVRIADQLEALGQRGRLARESPRAAALMAWCYLHAARIADVDATLDAAESGPEVDMIRYARWLLADGPDKSMPVRPTPTGGAIDALSHVSSYHLGRLSELVEPFGSRWAEAVSTPFRIAAMRALGRTQEALLAYEERGKDGALGVAFDATLAPEILIDAGQLDAARQAIAFGRRRAQASGSLGYEAVNRVLEAKLALRLERDPGRARALLDQLERDTAVRQFRQTSDLLDLWYGLALLQLGDDKAAAQRLRRAAESMLAGGRKLELPTGGVYLAEAEWRLENEVAADAAADLALGAARDQGSNHLLLQALRDFPSVASRRIDAEPSADSPWHDIGRVLRKQLNCGAPTPAQVRMKDLGSPKILVDDTEVRPGLGKSYELLALMISRRHERGGTLGRDALLNALFDGRDHPSTRAYLRQAIHRLRSVLPDKTLITSDAAIGIGGDITVTSDAEQLESQLNEAARLQGGQRLDATLAALEEYSDTPFLPEVDSEWARVRRNRLADAITEARFAAAELAFMAGRLTQAQELADESLLGNPYSEAAWRLVMRIANALGDERDVFAAFHRCEQALSQLGAAPSASTRQLLDALRR